MAIGMGTPETSTRVPAWKRLGLKLKYAKDNIDENSDKTSNSTNTSTTQSQLHKVKKRSFEDTDPETPAKRAKPVPAQSTHSIPSRQFGAYPTRDSGVPPEKSDSFWSYNKAVPASTKTPKKIVFDDDGSNGVGNDEQADLKKGRPASLRKSVSFTPDTKAEDGFSASNFFKAWAAEQKAEGTEESTEQPESPSKEAKKQKKKKANKSKSTSLEPKAKAKAKSESSKSTEKSNDEDESPKEVPHYVHYLQQYYTDRDHWKFNKNSQKDLFKNLFNISRIPPEHNRAIIQYIKGLQGAAARERIAQEAEDILKEIWLAQNPGDESMSMESAAVRRLAYYRALEKHVERYIALGSPKTEYIDQQVEDLRREVERGRRAESILLEGLADAISRDTSSSGSTSTSLPPPPPPPQFSAAIGSSLEKTASQIPKGKRKRKARTDVSSDSSSSSEDDSDTSSSTPLEAAETPPTTTTTHDYPLPLPPGVRPYIDPKPWKCLDIDCDSEGFVSRPGRDTHVKRQHPSLELARLRADEEKSLPAHMLIRPWKCDRSGCARSGRGFQCRRDLRAHVKAVHERPRASSDDAPDRKNIKPTVTGIGIDSTSAANEKKKALGFLQDDDDEVDAESESDVEKPKRAPKKQKGKRKARRSEKSFGGFTSALLNEVRDRGDM
ncbi:Hypothetical predicted protein [Lecanosticta acicola]|uniref:WKF domain-containing protein n=1 Tax=Lecanosticta acicola TaxID=111012 RepID=A0AAI8Z6A6_9PEZI|nr:Hypothetical predicted protein [Lecanosticta acicola]